MPYKPNSRRKNARSAAITARAPRDPNVGQWSAEIVDGTNGILAELKRLEDRDDENETWVLQVIAPLPWGAGRYLVTARRFA